MSYGKQLAALHGAVVGRGLDAALPLTHDARADVFPPQARLMVYAGGYVQRLSGATLADFPGFAALVGEAQAVQLAQAFAQETPSQHYDLNLYPVQFADYLRGRVDGDAQAVAALEAAIAEVFWLPESAALDAQSLAGL
ncbi:MAG: DUF2063 domain-containing protein, partial [Proteobacteria bacterium]|nr:DUF2063 domain-containing protein [Pseudomonadota bacterium]